MNWQTDDSSYVASQPPVLLRLRPLLIVVAAAGAMLFGSGVAAADDPDLSTVISVTATPSTDFTSDPESLFVSPDFSDLRTAPAPDGITGTRIG